MHRLSRSAAPVLVGLGVFLIVAAGLVRFYAYPALAKVPSSYDTTTKLDAQGAQVLNFKTFKPETHDLAISARTLSDPSATPPDGVAIWQTSTTVTREDGTIFQQTRDMTPFDDVTGEAVSCDGCPSWVAEDDGTDVKEVPVKRDGLTLKFPFDTQKKSYQVWDDTIGKGTTATYEGTEEIQGLTVYKFVQQIPESVVETREVPGSMFGSDKASVDAEMVYGMTRTFYIEPVTGSPVNRIEVRTQELRYDGKSVPVFDATVQYTDDQVSTEVDDLSSKAMVLGALRMTVPLAFLVVGLLAVAGGLLLNRRNNRNDVDAPAQDGKPLVNA